MKRFTADGDYEVTITKAYIAEPKFAKDDPNAFDIVLECQTKEGAGGYWSGEMSNRPGKGNNAHLTQAQITMKALHGIGFEGQDLSKLEHYMLGKKAVAVVEGREYKEKMYYEIKYLNSNSNTPKPLDYKEVARRMATLGVVAAPPASPPPPAQDASDDVW